MTESLALGPLGQIARTVRDIDLSVRWYQDTLGLKLLYRFPGMAFFDLGGVRLYLQQSPEPAADSILYFRVDDIEAVHATLVGKGVAFSHAPRMIHKHENGVEEWMAFFTDPDDRSLALIMQKNAAV